MRTSYDVRSKHKLNIKYMLKSFPDLFEEVYFFSGYDLVPSKKCVTMKDEAATYAIITTTMVSTTTSTKLTTTNNDSTEKLKYSGQSDLSTEYENEGYAAAVFFNGTAVVNKTTSRITTSRSSTKATTKPTENRKCNGPPCLTPYLTTIRGETRDFHRILKDLNDNHLDSQSSDFLIRK